MQLHQFLRFITPNTAIMLFDIQGIEICRVSSKYDINVDFYEYPVLDISCGPSYINNSLHSIHITIQK